jgi:RNA polymerase sigma-70 factor (ECF subfamily)
MEKTVQAVKKAGLSNIAEFFAREYNKMVFFIRKRLNDEAHRDAEDIVQDVMLKLFELTDINVPLEKLSSYIYTALRNRIIDFMRARRQHIPLDEITEAQELSLTEAVKDELDPDDEMEEDEIYEALYEAIEQLDEDEKAVVVATEFDDVSFKELAEKWSTPIGTLLSRKTRAIDKIKKILIQGGAGI